MVHPRNPLHFPHLQENRIFLHPQPTRIRGRIQHVEFAQSLPLNRLESASRFPVKETLGLVATERPHHELTPYRAALNLKG